MGDAQSVAIIESIDRLQKSHIPMPTHQEIAANLDRVLASAEFVRAKRMSRFLHFVVEKTLAEDTEGLKERQIGIEVFDQPADWDPKLNNIVRGEARRLRSKLDSYYETVGVRDSVRISIPKGRYTAEFSVRTSPPVFLQQQRQDNVDVEVVSTMTVRSMLPASRRPSRFTVFALGFGAVLACFCILSWNHSAKAGEDNFEVVPFADEIGQEFSPAVSPDGQRIAYVWDGNGYNYDIYIKEVHKGTVARLTHDSSPDLDPAWSPDGTMLVYLRVLPDRVRVLAEAATGGPERVITETASPISGWGADSNPYFGCYGPAWSSDASRIVVTDRGTSGHGFALFSVSLKSGARTELTHPSGEARDTCPHVSPDGHRIAFVRITSHGVSDIHLVSEDGGEDRQLTFDGRAILGLNWMSDGELNWMSDGDRILFSSLRHGSYQLREISALHGGVSSQLPVDATSAVEPSVAQSGSWMAFTELEENWNIWRAPLTPAGIGRPELFLSSTGKNHSPSYSPDGKQIAFVSDRSGTPEVWLANEKGGGLRKLTNFGGPWLGSIRWSPDGQKIVFDARPHGHSNIFTMRVAGGQPVPVKEEPYEERRPTWSQDGQAIYFNSDRDGNLRIWKRSIGNGALQPVGPPGTNESIESPHGQALFFTTTDYEFWKCNTDGSEAQRLPISLHPQPGLDWSLGPRGLYFASDQDVQPGFFFYNFSTRTTTLIGHPERAFAPGTPSLIVSPDGRWVLYAQLDHVSTDIKIRRSMSVPPAEYTLRFNRWKQLSWNAFLSSTEALSRKLFGRISLADRGSQLSELR